jgi:hypothetical protein
MEKQWDEGRVRLRRLEEGGKAIFNCGVEGGLAEIAWSGEINVDVMG